MKMKRKAYDMERKKRIINAVFTAVEKSNKLRLKRDAFTPLPAECMDALLECLAVVVAVGVGPNPSEKLLGITKRTFSMMFDECLELAITTIADHRADMVVVH
jgi:hypothetical protein